MLAAAVPLKPGEAFVDLGCGVGTLGLCLAARLGRDWAAQEPVHGLGLEQDPELAQLARTNAAELGSKFEVQVGDLFAATPHPAAWVVSNPPFFEVEAGRPPSDPQRRRGRHGAVGIAAWVQRAKAWVAPRGFMGLVIASAQLPEVLRALTPDFGGVCAKPLIDQPRKATVARTLVFARQGSRSPFQLAAPFGVRDGAGNLTPAATAILHDGAAMDLPLLK